MKTKQKILLGAALVASLSFSVGAYALTASADETSLAYTQAQIVDINNEKLDNGNSLVMELSVTDYMTSSGWEHKDYKWLNCEDIDTSLSHRGDVDLTKNNLCNIPLTENLDAYNFVDYIYLDGVSLAEFGQVHAYKLIANKRTRVNTISFDFSNGVLQSVSKVEIKEGCTLPTLQYSYLNQTETALLITETIVFSRIEGKWTDFAGYEEGKVYNGDDKIFEKSGENEFKGHDATPLDGFTEFFKNNEIQGEKLNHKALSSSSETQQGKLMVLKLDFPIDSAQFNKIVLRVYTNYKRSLRTYNANDITATSLGEAMEEFSVGGGLFFEISLTTALYANADGRVDTIVFEFADDGRVEANGGRHQFFFVSLGVANEPILTKDSFSIRESTNEYALTLRFNKSGKDNENAVVDPTKLFINGYSFADIQAECSEVTAEWKTTKGVYQIEVKLPKTYVGAAQVKNAAYGYAGNSMGVAKGLLFPNGDSLEKTYANHIYEGEKLLDSEMATKYKTVAVQSVGYRYASDSNNLRFTLYFDQEIVSTPYYHACERETWRASELTKGNSDLYDADVTQSFVNGGYKSSLLDSITINGKTISEWHAHDKNALTCVQIHYGNTALNCVDIIFEKASPNTYDGMNALVQSGSGVTIEVKAGYKFMSGKATAETQVFVLENGAFRQALAQAPLAVYFNGAPVEQGETIVLSTPVSEKSLAIKGVTNYQISTQKNGEYTIYTITYGDGEIFLFQIKGELTSAQPQTIKTEEGCGSVISGMSALGAAVLLAAVRMLKGGKKHEEN